MEDLPEPTEYQSIMAYLDVVSEELDEGEMVHGENFSLAEAMAALEIMDPKMDTGMNAGDILTLDERIEQSKIPQDSTLSVQQILGIMDQLMVLEAAWYGGHSLAQTLFTCLYMHRTTILENRYLEIFCKALIRTAATVRNVVVRADVYEEEDFVAQTFGFELEQGPETEQLIKNINSIEEDLSAKVRQSKGKKVDNVTPLQSDPSKEADLCEALLARIRLRRGMLTLHQHFERVTKSFENAKKAITFTQTQTALIRKSFSLGIPVAEVFEPLIIKRLGATSPPRHIDLPTLDQAFDMFDKLLNDLTAICGITECTTLRQLQDFFLLFSKRKPNVVSRSRLRVLFKDSPPEFFNKVKGTDLVAESMLSFSVFEAPWLKTHQAMELIERSATVVFQLFHILCRNRSRQRRALAHTFESWALLQQEADQLDAMIDEKRTESRFTLWMADQTIAVMNHFQFLGIEIELFEDHELPAVYWYLDYTLGRYVHNQADAATIAKLRTQNKAARKGRKPNARKDKPEAPPMTPLQLIAEAQQALSRGIMRLMFGLMRDNRFQSPDLTFGSSDIRFFHRFWPFVRLQNPLPLNHQLFEQYTNYSNHSPSTIYQSAVDCFKLAQNCLERLIAAPNTIPACYTVPELRSVAKVALGNSVQTQLLLRLCSTSNESQNSSSAPAVPQRAKLTLDFSVHDHFPIVKVPLK